MNKVESKLKNIVLFIVGAIFFIVGYSIFQKNAAEDGRSGATALENEE